MEKNQILMIYGKDAASMTKRLLEAADLKGLLPRRDMRVGIKPNLVVAGRAEDGCVTHPGIVAGVIEYLQANGYTNVCVLEGSWVGDRTAEAYRTSGIGEVCRAHGIECLDLQKDTHEKRTVGGFELEICSQALALDFLINLPVVKGHCQTKMTCALKNHKGLIPNSEKRRFHSLGLHRPIAHLAAAFPDQLIVADNICGDLDFEEGGNPVPMDRILCGRDPVLMDAFACEIMGYDVDEVPYIRMAEALGAGFADLSRAECISLNESRAGGKLGRPTRRVAKLAGYAEQREACSACYGALIHALDRLDAAGGLRGLREKICIGRGFRGAEGKIGIGACTRGFEKSCPGCPPSAAEILRFLTEEVL